MRKVTSSKPHRLDRMKDSGESAWGVHEMGGWPRHGGNEMGGWPRHGGEEENHCPYRISNPGLMTWIHLYIIFVEGAVNGKTLERHAAAGYIPYPAILPSRLCRMNENWREPVSVIECSVLNDTLVTLWRINDHGRCAFRRGSFTGPVMATG